MKRKDRPDSVGFWWSVEDEDWNMCYVSRPIGRDGLDILWIGDEVPERAADRLPGEFYGPIEPPNAKNEG